MSAGMAIARFITKSFPALTVGFSILAFIAPQYFLFYGKTIIFMLGLIMLGMGLTMTVEDFRLVFSRPRDVLVGVVGRYVLMPGIAWILVKVFPMDPMVAAGVLLVGCCPSGTSSNVMTFLARGDAALSVTVSSVNTLLAPILTPYIFLFLADSIIPIDATALLVDILKIVISPIVAGVIIRSFFPGAVARLMPYLPAISVVLILAILSFVVAANVGRLAAVAVIICAVVVIQNCLGYITGYGLGKATGMDHAKAKAVSFEIGIENSALAVALAVAHLSPIAAVPGAVFSFVEILTGSLLAAYWANRAMKQEESAALQEVVETSV